MAKLFNSKLWEGLSKVTDIILLSIYFLVCSIPVFTIGASLTGLYYGIHKVTFRGRAYTTEFFRSFKGNFKQCTLSWLIFLLLFAVLGADVYIMKAGIDSSSPFAGAWVAFVILLALAAIWAIYHFSYIARFENTFKESFKLSLYFTFAHLGWSLLMLAIVVAGLCLAYVQAWLIIFMPGILACCLHPILEYIFRKYMSPEDLAREDN